VGKIKKVHSKKGFGKYTETEGAIDKAAAKVAAMRKIYA
jgi:predicted phage gp36 major capsid-like protein